MLDNVSQLYWAFPLSVLVACDDEEKRFMTLKTGRDQDWGGVQERWILHRPLSELGTGTNWEHSVQN